jgi:hypothetical protein
MGGWLPWRRATLSQALWQIFCFIDEPKSGSSLAACGLMPRAWLKEARMLWTIFVILLILWLLGFFAFHVAGGLIHILLVLAVIVLIVRLVQGRRVV